MNFIVNLKFVLKLFIYVFIFISFISFIQLFWINKNIQKIKRTNVEGLINLQKDNILNKEDAFCETHRNSSGVLNESCKKLTKQNCLSTSCCVYLSDDTCVAGSASGPTFNSDLHGKTKSNDYFLFQDTCSSSNKENCLNK